MPVGANTRTYRLVTNAPQFRHSDMLLSLDARHFVLSVDVDIELITIGISTDLQGFHITDIRFVEITVRDTGRVSVTDISATIDSD